MAHIVVGTAGHIDHGKSSLVRALTGTDPDRLPEEKRRGITLDLGFAFLDDVAAIIDVPGHERLIRNMVAGAATIDFALVVVAADDGVMPQTVEHLEILRLLGVQQGAIVLTKADLVDPDWLSLVADQVRHTVARTFLAGAPLFVVDSLSGRGVTELRHFLLTHLPTLPKRSAHGAFRLPVDRVFTVKGHGTVVTGTILSGRVHRDARVIALPGADEFRVKRLESHGQEYETLSAGQRAALNILGRHDNLSRGTTLAFPNTLHPTTCIRAVVELLPSVPSIKDRQRVRLLITTQEVFARVQILEQSADHLFVNMHLEEAIVAVWGDRFIIRQYSPLLTLGGGRVLDPHATPLRKRVLHTELQFTRDVNCVDLREAVRAFLRWKGRFALPLAALAADFGLLPDELRSLARSLPETETVIECDNYFCLRQHFEALVQAVLERLAALHRTTTTATGFSRADLSVGDIARFPAPLLDRALEELTARGQVSRHGSLYRLSQHQVTLNAAQRELHERILQQLQQAAFTPPSAGQLSEMLNVPRNEIEKMLVLMEKLGSCRRLGTDLFFAADRFSEAVEAVRNVLAASAELSIAEATRMLASSRKYVVPFLEYLDSCGITARAGNVRIPGPKLLSRRPS